MYEMQNIIDASFAATVDSETVAGSIVSGGAESIFFPHTGKYATSIILDSFGQYSLFLGSLVQTEGTFLNFWIYLMDAADWNSVSIFVGELDDEFADNGEAASIEIPLTQAINGMKLRCETVMFWMHLEY